VSAEVVSLGGLSRQTGKSSEAREPFQAGLPVGAQVMLAGVNREVKIGAGARRAHPGAVESDADGGVQQFTRVPPVIFNDIDQGLAGFGLRDRPVRRKLCVEADARRAARGLRLGETWVGLTKGGGYKKQQGKKRSHGFPSGATAPSVGAPAGGAEPACPMIADYASSITEISGWLPVRIVGPQVPAPLHVYRV